MKILKLFKYFFSIIFYIYVMRYTKYKTRAKIVLTGDDDLYSNNSGST